jgi:hypothetical protein
MLAKIRGELLIYVFFSSILRYQDQGHLHVQSLSSHRQTADRRSQRVPREQQDAAAFHAQPAYPPVLGGQRRWVKLRVSSKGLRMIDKQGIDAVLADMRQRGERV